LGEKGERGFWRSKFVARIAGEKDLHFSLAVLWRDLIAVARMYLERVQKKHKGKTYTSVLLRQSVRIGKKVVRRTICSLTHLPPDL